jgi:hypothetical protein
MRAGLLLLVVLLAACRIVPLADPPPIAAGLPTPELTRLAVHRALALEGFVVEEEVPGRVRAHLQRRDWAMLVEVDYGADVTIHYVASTALHFEVRDGKRYIHHGYNERAQRLADSVRHEAQLILADVDPDAFLGKSVSAPPPPTELAH